MRLRIASLLSHSLCASVIVIASCGGDSKTTPQEFATTYAASWGPYCKRFAECDDIEDEENSESECLLTRPDVKDVEAAVAEVQWTSEEMDSCSRAVRAADECMIASSCELFNNLSIEGSVAPCSDKEDSDLCCFDDDAEPIECTKEIAPCISKLNVVGRSCGKMTRVLFPQD